MSDYESIVAALPTVDTDRVLDDAHEFIGRFCSFPTEHAHLAVTLWAAHAHMVEEFHTSPRLALLSPEPGSGKTRVLEVLDTLVPEPMFSLSASPAAVFRTLADRQITLLFDEIDTVFRAKGKDDNNEDLRALLNAGYKRGATIPRCVGSKHEVQHFAVFAPVALAGLGSLPDTIMTRSVVVRMRRRAPGEYVEPWRTRLHEPEGNRIRDRLAAWAELVAPQVGSAWPELPDGIVDRPAEVWEPLVAVVDAAGGDWPDRARRACVALVRAAEDREASLGVRLLSDLRVIFGDALALHTETILDRLVKGDGLDDDAPWESIRGAPVSSRLLASLLRGYGIRSRKVKVNGVSLQGYRREDLWDAWSRYLPSVPAETEPPEPEEPLTPQDNESRASEGSGSSVSSGIRVPDVSASTEPEAPLQAASSLDGAGGSVGSGLAEPKTCAACGGEGCNWCDASHLEEPF